MAAGDMIFVAAFILAFGALAAVLGYANRRARRTGPSAGKPLDSGGP